MKTNLLRILLLAIIAAFVFAPSHKAQAAGSQLRITEIMYDPSGTGDREFVEIYNGSDTTANLSGMSMYGVDFVFFSGTSLSPGQYGVLARNSAALRASHPSARIFGQYGGKLRGTGETVRLISNGTILSQVAYSFGGAWPSTPRNGGPSLSLIRTSANEATPACWLASTTSGGTPGSANGVAASSQGGCDNKSYPVTQAGPAPTNNAPGAAGAATTATTTTPAAAAPTATPASAQQTQDQKAQEQKITEVAAKKAASPTLAAIKIDQQSKDRLKVSGFLLALVALMALALIAWQRHHKLARFKKLTKPKGQRGRKR